MKHFAPPLVRIATEEDAPFVSAIAGMPAGDYMRRIHTLVTPCGFFFLEPITSSVFEAHMGFLKAGRGAHALKAARQGLELCFEVLGAQVVFGRIPVEDKAARLFTRMIGLRSDGFREREPGGPLCEWFEIVKGGDLCRRQ